MILEITNQERYSRGELLLRFFFGWFYIALPHLFLLLFIGIASQVLTFIAFWVILFTGSYPESFFEFQVKVMRWSVRVQARLWNLCDGYPAFGFEAEDEFVKFDVKYPERLSRGHLLLKFFFGLLYCALPHQFILIFRLIGAMFIQFIAFWIVLFTGEYPESMHRYMVGTIRWSVRVQLYLGFMTDDYPPFSGRPDGEREEAPGTQPATSPA